MSESITLKARCVKCCFKKDDYRIFSWSPIDHNDSVKLSLYFTFSTKGNDSYIDENKDYEIEIEEIAYDKRYGGTYKILSVPSMSNFDVSTLTLDQKKEILMDCTTSERIADNILEAYPDFIELILTKGKDVIDVSRIKGVGEIYLSAYARNLLEKYKYLGIIQHFKDYKFDVSDCKKLIEEYLDEEHIAKEIQSNPYKVLISTLGRSFEFADRMIMELREDLKVSEMRCAYLILSVLERNEQEGDTRLNGNDLYYYIMEEYSVPELEPLIVPTATNNDLFYYDEESKDLSIMSTYQGECYVADFVKDKIMNSKQLDIDYTKYINIDGFQLSEKQSKALELFCQYNFMILAGFSGSGKTSSLKGLIKLMEDNNLSYTLLSSTGKASLRMAEATHRPTSTVHRQCLKDGEIFSDCVILDEATMNDLPTIVMLFKHITNENARIVFVGDFKQLSCVGVGRVFSDLINSGKVPSITLDEIFRYKSNGSLFVATNVRQGKQFFDDDEMVKHIGNRYKICDNYEFIETNDILDTVKEEYIKLIDKNIKPKNILCLSPMNVGEEGTYIINNEIQAIINPPKPNDKIMARQINKTNIIFRVGDVVINTKNDYKAMPLESYKEIQNSDKILTSDDVELTQVFNGQCGVIREVNDNMMVIEFDNELIVFDKPKLQNLLLAYCITIHKSQGSESDYVINIVSEKHTKMLSKNLLYVADTRAKKKVVDIGSISAFNNALLVDEDEQRNTWLKELL